MAPAGLDGRQSRLSFLGNKEALHMFALTRYHPTHHAFQNLGLEPLLGEFFRPFGENSREPRGPQAEVRWTDQALTLGFDVPGYDGKDIEVRVEGETLHVSGKTEHRQQSFERAYTLPTTVDAQRAEAVCKNGVLTVTLPKREEAKPKRSASMWLRNSRLRSS